MNKYIKALRFLEKFKKIQNGGLILGRQFGKTTVVASLWEQSKYATIIVKRYRKSRYKINNKKVRIWEK